MTTLKITPSEFGPKQRPEDLCEIHDWETEGLARRLITTMRDRWPGHVTVCKDCVTRAYGSLPPRGKK